MGRSRRAAKPSDPQTILVRRAQERALERIREREPARWGVAPELLALETANDVEAISDERGRVFHARRSDPFDLLHTARGLSDWQHQAAQMLVRLYCERHGVRLDDPAPRERVDDVKLGALEVVMGAAVDAQATIRWALGQIGPVNARLLHALIEPMVALGAVIAWRGVVERVTGEKDRNAQGALVRQACEALRLVWGLGPKPEGFALMNDWRALDLEDAANG
jgi:hypothetical protein